MLALAATLPPWWIKWLFAFVAAHSFYCLFNEKQRNAVYCDLHRLRGMPRTGAPVSVRTNILVVVFWGSLTAALFLPTAWSWQGWVPLTFGAMAAGMISSYLDVRKYRRGPYPRY